MWYAALKAIVAKAVCWVGFRFGILRMVFMGTSDV